MEQKYTDAMDDPQLRQMLTTHIHCGEVMEVIAVQPPERERRGGTADGGVLTYHCACGFNFDQEPPERQA